MSDTRNDPRPQALRGHRVACRETKSEMLLNSAHKCCPRGADTRPSPKKRSDQGSATSAPGSITLGPISAWFGFVLACLGILLIYFWFVFGSFFSICLAPTAHPNPLTLCYYSFWLLFGSPLASFWLSLAALSFPVSHIFGHASLGSILLVMGGGRLLNYSPPPPPPPKGAHY